jgi:hypothetical protein
VTFLRTTFTGGGIKSSLSSYSFLYNWTSFFGSLSTYSSFFVGFSTVVVVFLISSTTGTPVATPSPSNFFFFFFFFSPLGFFTFLGAFGSSGPLSVTSSEECSLMSSI